MASRTLIGIRRLHWVNIELSRKRGSSGYPHHVCPHYQEGWKSPPTSCQVLHHCSWEPWRPCLEEKWQLCPCPPSGFSLFPHKHGGRILSSPSLGWFYKCILSFFLMRLLLFTPLVAIPMPPLMNIGSSNGCFKNFGTACGIGMTKLMPSSSQLGSPHCLRTLVSIQDSYVTPWILHWSLHWRRCPLVSTLTTLSLSQKILRLKLSSVIF